MIAEKGYTANLVEVVISNGIDEMVAWRSVYYMVLDFGLQEIIEGKDGWTFEDVVVVGEIENPTNLMINRFVTCGLSLLNSSTCLMRIPSCLSKRHLRSCTPLSTELKMS